MIKLKSSFKILNISINNLKTRNITKYVNPLLNKTTTNTLESKEKWDLITALCLERKPLLTKEFNDIEKKTQTLFNEIENEYSLKSDHELREISDQVRIQKLKDGTLNVDMLDDTTQTAQDFVDNSNTELNKFKIGSRITEDDKQNNIKSLNRKLDKNLVFLINEKLGDKSHWVMPSDKRLEGETLRQTAERIITDKIDKNIKTRIYGNAPCGFYKYKYPKSLREENNTVGAKIFFYKAQYLDGNVNIKGVDYTWASREELTKLLSEEYNKSVGMFLIDE